MKHGWCIKSNKKGGAHMTNTKLLERKIRQSGIKKGYIAERLGVSRTTFRALMCNSTEFKASQIKTLCEILGIKDDETMKDIFFA
jgi:transcriptional regulator with XRE-family HTH domain